MLTSNVVLPNGLGLYKKPIMVRGKADNAITMDGYTCPNCSTTMALAQQWEGCLECGYVERPRH